MPIAPKLLPATSLAFASNGRVHGHDPKQFDMPVAADSVAAQRAVGHSCHCVSRPERKKNTTQSNRAALQGRPPSPVEMGVRPLERPAKRPCCKAPHLLTCRLVLLRACVQNSAGGACAGGRWGWRWQYCRLRLRLRLRTRLTNAPGWHQELAAGGTWRTGMGRVMPYVTPRCRGFRGSALGSLRGT
jgi:hypothetical protein